MYPLTWNTPSTCFYTLQQHSTDSLWPPKRWMRVLHSSRHLSVPFCQRHHVLSPPGKCRQWWQKAIVLTGAACTHFSLALSAYVIPQTSPGLTTSWISGSFLMILKQQQQIQSHMSTNRKLQLKISFVLCLHVPLFTTNAVPTLPIHC